MLWRKIPLLVVLALIGGLNPPSLKAATGYWSFDNQINVGHDDSGGNYDGIDSDVTWISDGQINGALSFLGNAYVEVENFPSATNYVEFSAWVRLDNVGDSGYVLCKGKHLTPEEYSITITEDTSLPMVNVHVGGSYYHAQGTVQLELGEWTFLQGIYDGTGSGAGLTLNVYDSDNQSIDYAFESVSGNLDQNSESLWFGVDYGNWESDWDGSIDEVSVTVPEPVSLSLFVFGGLVLIRRR